MTAVLITLGSNIDKEISLPRAIAALRAHAHVEVQAVSPTYETPALNSSGTRADQPAFHNAAVLVETSLSALELRGALRAIEAALGRVRTTDKFAPRPIDLDIALFGDQSLIIEGTQIPDPDVVCFPHIALPLADIAPHWHHPHDGCTLRTIADSLNARGMEIKKV